MAMFNIWLIIGGNKYLKCIAPAGGGAKYKDPLNIGIFSVLNNQPFVGIKQR